MKILIILSVLVCAVFTFRLNKWQIREPIDLTWPIDETSITWPGTQSFVYTRKSAEFNADGKWYASHEFCTGEHSGTHLDAPYHFYKYGWKVANISPERLIGHGVVIDMSELVRTLGPTVQLQKMDLVDWERIHGPLPPHCIVLVRFGWSEYYKSREIYLGLNGTNMIFPGISPEAAEWFVNTDKVVGIGVDTASIDSGAVSGFTSHRILAENNIFLMENVNIVKKLPARGFTVLAFPMKLKEGSGAPLRIVAIPDIILTTDTKCSPLDFTPSEVPWYGHTSVVLCSLLLLGMYVINCFTL